MHKKLLLFLTLIVVLFIGTEIYGYYSKSAFIQQAHLSKREQNLVKVGGADNPMVFSYQLPRAKMTQVDYWVEVYQDGKDLGKQMESGDRIQAEKHGMLAFAIQHPKKSGQWGKWLLSGFSQKGFIQASATRNMKPFKGSTMIVQTHGEAIKAGKPITLAVIFNDPKSGLMKMPEMKNKQALIQLSRGLKTVLVFRCKFTEGK